LEPNGVFILKKIVMSVTVDWSEVFTNTETPLHQPFQDIYLLPHDEGTSFSEAWVISYRLQGVTEQRSDSKCMQCFLLCL